MSPKAALSGELCQWRKQRSRGRADVLLNDNEMRTVIKHLSDGWPEYKDKPQNVWVYMKVKNELSETEGLVRRIGAASAVMQTLHGSVMVKGEPSPKAKLSMHRSIFVPTLTTVMSFGSWPKEQDCGFKRPKGASTVGWLGSPLEVEKLKQICQQNYSFTSGMCHMVSDSSQPFRGNHRTAKYYSYVTSKAIEFPEIEKRIKRFKQKDHLYPTNRKWCLGLCLQTKTRKKPWIILNLLLCEIWHWTVRCKQLNFLWVHILCVW